MTVCLSINPNKHWKDVVSCSDWYVKLGWTVAVCGRKDKKTVEFVLHCLIKTTRKSILGSNGMTKPDCSLSAL